MKNPLEEFKKLKARKETIEAQFEEMRRRPDDVGEAYLYFLHDDYERVCQSLADWSGISPQNYPA